MARFLTSKNHYSRAAVKYGAFMPPPDKKLSVFRIDGLGEPATWKLGDDHITAETGRTVHGRGDIVQGEVERQGLALDHDNRPPRHANIIGWPDEKHRQKLIALELAAAASPPILRS